MSNRHEDSAEAGPRPGDGTASERLREVEAATVVSRRGVLWRTGLATVAGAAALTALDERRADAATGGNFILGNNNTAASTTELSGTASPVMQLDGGTLNATGTTLVVNGPHGGAGLFASGTSTTSTTGLAINGTGTGTANGIFGASSDSGIGVQGSSVSGTGVAGTSTSGAGVRGTSDSGNGVLASSSTGHALSVHGRTYFSLSGSGSVSAGHSVESVSVSGLTSSSLVLVTLQSAFSDVYVQSAVPASGHFTVHLSKKAPHATKFAWFVLN
jgi:hypothetical protein